jgi:multidrug resistance efflux pump
MTRPRLLLLLTGLVLLSGCGTTSTAFQGVVEAQEETLAFAEPGRVVTVLVAEGQRIDSESEVARIDGDSQRLALATAEADQRVAEAQLADVRAGARPEVIAASEARVAAARAEADNAATDLVRLNKLFAEVIVSEQDRDAGVRRDLEARAAVAVAEQQLAELRAGGSAPRIAVAEAELSAARARVASARDQVAKTTLRSPLGARVVRHIHLYPGMWANPGTAALTVADLDHPYVDVFVPQAVASGLKPGQMAQARFDRATSAVGAATPIPVQAEGRVERIGERLEYTPRYLFGPADRPHLMIRVRVRLTGSVPAAGVPADVTFGAAP